METSAKIIADSINPVGKRVTTLQLRMHRFILSELNTHRAFSRNTSSSRAIPTWKLRKMAVENTAYPVSWGVNRSGMQATEQLGDDAEKEARMAWKEAAIAAVAQAEKLESLRVHKQVTNRLLEPFLWANTIVTSTEWDNFFKLRMHQDAQPEFMELAHKMYDAMEGSTPRILEAGQWHLPYVPETSTLINRHKIIMSVARCARVSYLTFDGKETELADDMKLFYRLRDNGHLSPFEHQCVATEDNNAYYNLLGWKSLRYAHFYSL